MSSIASNGDTAAVATQYRLQHPELIRQHPELPAWLDSSYVPIAGAWQY